MYFYHEGYRDAYYAAATLDDLRPRDRRDEDPSYEPTRFPAIVNWLAIVCVALCVIVAVIQAMS